MEASQTSPPRQKTSFIGGSQPLWKAFWILYVLGSLSFTATALVLLQLPTVHYALSQVSHILNLQAETTVIMTAAAIAVTYIMYFLFCSISVWRCSINTVKKYWGASRKIFNLNKFRLGLLEGICRLRLFGKVFFKSIIWQHIKLHINLTSGSSRSLRSLGRPQAAAP